MDAPDPIKPEKPKSEISNARILIWIVVAGVGLYLVISGLMGILVKAS